MKLRSKKEVVEYINTLNDYNGYVQFSHRRLNKDTDIFIDRDININDETGFVFEAHFYNSQKSISIKQFNDAWNVIEQDISDISKSDIVEYKAISSYMVSMAQVWEVEKDDLCLGMEVNKIKNVVFVGISKGEEND